MWLTFSLNFLKIHHKALNKHKSHLDACQWHHLERPAFAARYSPCVGHWASHLAQEACIFTAWWQNSQDFVRRWNWQKVKVIEEGMAVWGVLLAANCFKSKCWIQTGRGVGVSVNHVLYCCFHWSLVSKCNKEFRGSFTWTWEFLGACLESVICWCTTTADIFT